MGLLEGGDLAAAVAAAEAHRVADAAASLLHALSAPQAARAHTPPAGGGRAHAAHGAPGGGPSAAATAGAPGPAAAGAGTGANGNGEPFPPGAVAFTPPGEPVVGAVRALVSEFGAPFVTRGAAVLAQWGVPAAVADALALLAEDSSVVSTAPPTDPDARRAAAPGPRGGGRGVATAAGGKAVGGPPASQEAVCAVLRAAIAQQNALLQRLVSELRDSRADAREAHEEAGRLRDDRDTLALELATQLGHSAARAGGAGSTAGASFTAGSATAAAMARGVGGAAARFGLQVGAGGGVSAAAVGAAGGAPAPQLRPPPPLPADGDLSRDGPDGSLDGLGGLGDAMASAAAAAGVSEAVSLSLVGAGLFDAAAVALAEERARLRGSGPASAAGGGPPLLPPATPPRPTSVSADAAASGRYTHSRSGPARSATARLMGAGRDNGLRLRTLDDAVALLAQKDRFIARLTAQHDTVKLQIKGLVDALSAAQARASDEHGKRAAVEATLVAARDALSEQEAAHEARIAALRAQYGVREQALLAARSGMAAQVEGLLRMSSRRDASEDRAGSVNGSMYD